MSRKLRKQIEVEREQLHQAIKLHRPLLDRAGTRELDAIELSAAAAFLHSFYTGIENIFERIAIDLDGANPSGTRWHRDILDRMALAAGLRPRVISEGLRAELAQYLVFRHFFRNAYVFHLRWEKMEDLVRGCERVFGSLEKELDLFLELLDSEG